MEKVNYKITEKSHIKMLFLLCWLSYFSTYLGRLNYSAGLTEIIQSEGFTKGQAGIIGTAFFLAYGGGQFVSGFLGDRLSPRKMVFTGLFISAIANLLMSVSSSYLIMTVIWCFNGLFQAFIWSPMIRLMFEYYKTETRTQACVYLNSSVPIGTMAAYGGTAALIWLSGWRMTFVFAGFLLLVISAVWFVGMGRLEAYAEKYGEPELPAPVPAVGQRSSQAGIFSWKSLLIESGFLLLMAALFVQGALKDGVTTWVPAYISETYQLENIIAIVSTMVIPIFNLSGVFLASIANIRLFKNEIRTAGEFFLVCAVSLLILWGVSGKSVVISFMMLAISTTAMMAVNTMLIAVLPSHFGVIGKASSISGLLNSSVYVGGAISTYGIGTLSVIIGWEGTILVWFFLAVLAMGLCFAVVKPWLRYRKQVLHL